MKISQFNSTFAQKPNLLSKNKVANLNFEGLSPTPQNRDIVYRITDEIRNAQNIGIVMHRGPDRDATGSAEALRDLALAQPNIRRADILIEESGIPRELVPYKNAGTLIDLNTQSPPCNYDLGISVDCAELKLMRPKTRELFEQTPRKIKIDHHPVRTQEPENSFYANLNLIDPTVCSASELIMQLVEPLDVQLKPETAASIYSGMLTDTQGFRYLNDPAQTFEDAAILAKTGIDTTQLYRDNMDKMTRPQFELYRGTLNDVKFSDNGEITCVVPDRTKAGQEITSQDCSEITHRIVDTILPNIEGVKVAISHNPNTGGTSLRSAYMPVKEIAEHFGGGGHEFASACCMKGKLPELLEFVEKKLSND